MALSLPAFPPSSSFLYSKPSRLHFGPSAFNTLSIGNGGRTVDSMGAISGNQRFLWILEKKTKRKTYTKGKETRGGISLVCSASVAGLSHETLQWVSAVATAILMLIKGTAIQKSFLVPLFALQAPFSVISWIKGDYGTWTAFLALLVRLFYFIPGELDLPFLAMLLVISAPYQVMDLRRSQPSAIISLAIAVYLAFQHFSRAGSLQRAFDQGAIIATLAIISITAVPCLLLF